LFRTANRRRGLTALEFVRVDEPQDLLDQRAIVTGGRNLIDLVPLFDVQPQDSVERLIRWKRVLIRLIRLELGRRRLGDRRTRDDFTIAIDPVRDAIDRRLVDVAE